MKFVSVRRTHGHFIKTYIEHLMREKEEEFSRDTSVIETIFTVELDHQTFLQVTRRLPHNLSVGVLKDVISPDLDLAVARLSAHGRLTPEVDELPAEVTLVLRHVGIGAWTVDEDRPKW